MPRTARALNPLKSVAREAQRELVLRSTAQLIDERGVRGVNVREVANRVGASTMAVYSLFGSKDGLIDALFEAGLDALGRAGHTAIRELAEPIAKLWAIASAYREFALEQRAAFRVVVHRLSQGGEYSDRVRNGANFKILLETVAEAIDAGQLSGPADVVADVLWAGVHGFVGLELAGCFATPAEAQERYARMGAALFAGLGAES